MNTTINISLPKSLYKDAKRLVAEGKYSSISEIMRAGLRRVLYDADKITENGLPGWFEDRVLESAQEPIKKSSVWESEEDMKKYFEKLHKEKSGKSKKKDDKSRPDWQIQPVVR